jgi:fermentation-respiration switch protein FrsA (DUF1100 family)
MKWLLLVVALLCSVVVAVLLLQRAIIFPIRAIPLPRAPPPGGETWWLETANGAVEARFLPGLRASAERPAPLVVFTHGNGELIDYWVADMAPYQQAGFNVLLPEYRGYGRSAGRPSQKGIVSDSLAFLSRAQARPEVDPDRLVFHGRSLGGGVACALAAVRAPSALVLQSTFSSLALMAWQSMGVPRLLVRDPFDNASVVSDLDVPLLVIHGRHDEVIPYAQGQALAAASRNGRLVTREYGHNDLPMDSGFWQEVLAFLGESGLRQPPQR